MYDLDIPAPEGFITLSQLKLLPVFGSRVWSEVCFNIGQQALLTLGSSTREEILECSMKMLGHLGVIIVETVAVGDGKVQLDMKPVYVILDEDGKE